MNGSLFSENTRYAQIEVFIFAVSSGEHVFPVAIVHGTTVFHVIQLDSLGNQLKHLIKSVCLRLGSEAEGGYA